MAVVVTLCALRGVVGVTLRLFGQVVGMALRALGCMLGVAPGLLGCVLRPAGQLRCLTLLARDLPMLWLTAPLWLAACRAAEKIPDGKGRSGLLRPFLPDMVTKRWNFSAESIILERNITIGRREGNPPAWEEPAL